MSRFPAKEFYHVIWREKGLVGILKNLSRHVHGWKYRGSDAYLRWQINVP